MQRADPCSEFRSLVKQARHGTGKTCQLGAAIKFYQGIIVPTTEEPVKESI